MFSNLPPASKAKKASRSSFRLERFMTAALAAALLWNLSWFSGVFDNQKVDQADNEIVDHL
jgi:hypothetical protein